MLYESSYSLIKWAHSVCSPCPGSACSGRVASRLLSEAADYHRSYSRMQGLLMLVILNIFAWDESLPDYHRSYGASLPASNFSHTGFDDGVARELLTQIAELNILCALMVVRGGWPDFYVRSASSFSGSPLALTARRNGRTDLGDDTATRTYSATATNVAVAHCCCCRARSCCQTSPR